MGGIHFIEVKYLGFMLGLGLGLTLNPFHTVKVHGLDTN